MSVRSKLRRAFEYLERPELARARLARVRVDFVGVLLELRDRYGIAPGTVIDAGANRGEYARAARFLFADADILLFEPIPELADALRREFEPLGGRVFAHALDRVSRTTTLFRTRADDLSSLLAPTPALASIIDDGERATASDSIEIEARRLDDVVDLATARRPILFKLDVQGAELAALEGSERSLAAVDCIQLEYNFAPLYAGQTGLRELLAFAEAHGFTRFVQVDLHVDRMRPASCDLVFFRD